MSMNDIVLFMEQDLMSIILLCSPISELRLYQERVTFTSEQCTLFLSSVTVLHSNFMNECWNYTFFKSSYTVFSSGHCSY